MSNDKYTDEELLKKYGKCKEIAGVILDTPAELGYRCLNGHSDLQFSDFNAHLWCIVCRKDYHYADDCVLISDYCNPKKLLEQPLKIYGVDNWDETGMYNPDIPKDIIEKARRDKHNEKKEL